MFPDAGRRMNVPVEPRPASTLILVRDGDGDGDGDGAQDAGRLEVLLVQRNVLADFVGGAHVFPGGGVDVEDASEEARDLSAGRSDAEASALLGTPAGGIGYWVAALRECFEEAGILLAYRSAEPAGGPGQGPVPALARRPGRLGPVPPAPGPRQLGSALLLGRLPFRGTHSRLRPRPLLRPLGHARDVAATV